MNNIVEMKNLTKKYMKKTALKDVNLNIEKGKIIGLLGPNGSGKTTMIKILMGILTQSTGEVSIAGKKPGTETKSMVSYLPDRNFLYKWMKIKDSIDLFDDFYNDFDREKAKKLLEFMELEEDMKVTKLSKGMQEKLNLTLVLSRNAKLYILDEPIAGVDPVAREKILDAIINNYNEDSSMLITTHLVHDLERVFEEVAFLKNGEIVLNGNVESLRNERNMSVDELYREVFK
ncbi:ABC transporter ATP-binding protein [Senegalia massiliensis]|uniref:ABC transporter ATP-binding protein n=1 Tax=Senegalia massiliensis TaxID=1720316 RepID=A0A845QVS8_9CLOT|nr:ABC transporter ATP-binding protein [Senegalia massiliensis]NBI05899.1 ABC transporter ATP-binding protein [Senegalia massiliensis]